MLDDPVQHVDDFRTVHLAELMAKLVAEGRQIICAVEDGALADLLSRRMPITDIGTANRVTLARDDSGDLAASVRTLPQLMRSALTNPDIASAI
jgi:hypothetical protein